MTKQLVLLTLLTVLGAEAAGFNSESDDPARQEAAAVIDRTLAEKFAALKLRYDARKKAFHDELRAANALEPTAHQRKVADENERFKADWFKMADEDRAIIKAHPSDPAALDGVILLMDTLSWSMDDDIVEIVRQHFMTDPRMGRLCASLGSRPEDSSRRILKDVSADHPVRAVRAQATYSLGVSSRDQADQMIAGRDRTEKEKEECLTGAARYFNQVATDYADVSSADGMFRLAEKAKAELARIVNLPNLKVGKIAPEITGEDLFGKPLKLADYRGKVVVVCFWATWCGPCMAMVPHERDLVKRLENKPFALLGVNSDESADREKAIKATREKQMTWRSWWDGGFRGAIQTAYNVDHWPTVYVLDAEGVIRYVDVRDGDLDLAVNKLLDEMLAPSKAKSLR